MAYVEMGEGDPIVFQHGNPTSSYLWRNIMPELVGHGRCIAVDLVGMGDSDKVDDPGPGSYRYVEHRDYLFQAWEKLGVSDNVTLVIHDWGSALGFDWAHRLYGRHRPTDQLGRVARGDSPAVRGISFRGW
jgi:haloalkane dehalogenase